MKTKLSFEKVPYILRPKKQIQRKILIEIFQRIQNYEKINISNYHYIGLGSIHYYDFILFHKFLNIYNMTSLDDKDTIKRFRFNKPYDFIKFKNTTTTEFLEKYHFKDKALIWFDYDAMLYNYNRDIKEDSILEDIELVTNRSKGKDFFILTININHPRKKDQKEKFIEKFDPYISSTYKNGISINEKTYRFIIQDIIVNYIKEQQKFQEIKFRKLFSFYYQDGAPMYTLGGVYDDSDELQNAFEEEQFVNPDENEITDIDVPILTYREKLYLDSKVSQLKKKFDNINNKEDLKEIIDKLEFEIDSTESLKNYIEYYKYYPQYYEGIV